MGTRLDGRQVMNLLAVFAFSSTQTLKNGDESCLSGALSFGRLLQTGTSPDNKERAGNTQLRNRCYGNELSQLKSNWYILKNRNYTDPAQRAFLHPVHPTDSCLPVKAQSRKSECSRRCGWRGPIWVS